MHLGKIHEIERALERLLGPFTLLHGQVIPFVDGYHQGAPGVEHITCDMGILIDDFFAAIKHQHYDVRILDRLHGLDD